ncbi:metal-dependent hydrolase [Castellaniella sp. GW247-6E4]|uniref:metal-dependent hydrolase n=1 Tax=Castellaniella sp. GW247-6E4 TaxID=3140380 RepID=UPI003314DBF1
MDSITQAALGASLCGAMLGRAHGRKAYAAGAALATLPDLDVLIRHADPLSAMIHHRGFSHALLTLTALAALLAWLFRRWRPHAAYTGPWLFAALWLTLATHPLLDAFTSYGTQLFWPWRPTPTAWSTIFIIDPFYTLPLLAAALAGLATGARPSNRRLACWALALSTAYLGGSVATKALVEHRVRAQIEQAGIPVQAMFSTPEPFSILLWRVVARTQAGDAIEAIAGLLDQGPAETLREPLNDHLAGAAADIPALDGLRWFTGGWLRYDEIDGQLVATDLRMGLAPGLYSFRFRVAERGASGRWRAVTPTRWPSPRGLDVLPIVLRRIWTQNPPLPLADWALDMNRPAAPAPAPRG